jgi:hypothetical protein
MPHVKAAPIRFRLGRTASQQKQESDEGAHRDYIQHLSELQNGLASQPISGISQPISAFTLIGTLTKHSKLSTQHLSSR